MVRAAMGTRGCGFPGNVYKTAAWFWRGEASPIVCGFCVLHLHAHSTGQRPLVFVCKAKRTRDIPRFVSVVACSCPLLRPRPVTTPNALLLGACREAANVRWAMLLTACMLLRTRIRSLDRSSRVSGLVPSANSSAGVCQAASALSGVPASRRCRCRGSSFWREALC